MSNANRRKKPSEVLRELHTPLAPRAQEKLGAELIRDSLPLPWELAKIEYMLDLPRPSTAARPSLETWVKIGTTPASIEKFKQLAGLLTAAESAWLHGSFFELFWIRLWS